LFYGLEVTILASTRVFIIAAYIIIAVPIVFLNLSVLVAIWKTPSLHKPSQVLLANLAVTDFLMGAVVSPLIVFGNFTVYKEWIHIYCSSWIIIGPFTFCLGGVNLYTLAVISVDRFLAIKLKLTYRAVVTNKRLIITLVTGWILSGSVLIIVTISLYKHVSLKDYKVPVVLYVAILLCTITLFYSMAFHHLRKITTQVSMDNSNEPSPNTSPTFDVTKYRRSFYTMLIVLLAVIFFFLPYSCFAAANVAFKTDTTKSLTRLGEFLFVSNSVINPLLYLWRMKDLRQAVKATVRGFLRCN
jgi:hypothetical protein